MENLATAAFGRATLRILKISYRCDLANDKGLVIPLGVLADMRAPDSYALGLVARSHLAADEAAQVGELIRAELSAPFGYLEPMFDEVMHAASPADAFEALQDRYSLSLVFEMSGAARQIDLPRAAKINAEARSLWLKDELRSQGNTAYWAMFDQKVPEVLDKESKEQDREAA